MNLVVMLVSLEWFDFFFVYHCYYIQWLGEIIKPMGKNKMLVKVGQEGKYVVDIEPSIDSSKCIANARVALRSDSYALHSILPTKVDPLVSLMKVEKVSSPLIFCVHTGTLFVS